MLTWYKDAALTKPVTGSSPVWIFSPPQGTTRTLSLWLADTSAVVIIRAAAVGATSIYLATGDFFPSTGSILVNGATIAYTANTGGVLTVAPLAVAIPINSLAYPVQTYSGATDLMFTSSGSLACSLKLPAQSQYGIPNTALLTNIASASSLGSTGPVALAQINVKVVVPAGDTAEIADVRVATCPLTSTLTPGQYELVQAVFVVERLDQSLSQCFRIFPASEIVQPNPPGFTWGQYRWRDESDINAQTVVPTEWDLDVNAIGREKFIAGIGHGDDLQPLELQQNGDSIKLLIQNGAYFTGPNRYFLPSDDGLVVQAPLNGQLQIQLPVAVRSQKPIYVGAMQIDSEGYYDDFVRYDCRWGGIDPTDSSYQFTLDATRTLITLSQGFSLTRMYLGSVPDSASATFDLPIVPVANVTQVTMGPYGSLPEQLVQGFSVDYKAGSVTVQIASPDTNATRDLFIYCQPAVMVIYEPDIDNPAETLTVPVELNPAFTGIDSGYVYLEHRKRRSASIQLSCDKPRVVIPAQFEMVSGLVAFGPVFYENDYALLEAEAFSEVAGEAVPGATLQVIPGSPFSGLVNSQDPVAGPVYLNTGADGTISFVYTPPDAFGQYLATSSVNGTDVTLPAGIPLQQVWNSTSGWLARLYAVYNDDPFFGIVGGLTGLGEVIWQAIGDPGTTGYRTNGKRVPLMAGSDPLLPVNAFDSNGVAYNASGFNGFVSKLRYGIDLPSASYIGSYFLTYIGWVSLTVQDTVTGVVSNQIILDLEAPPAIVDEDGISGYLTLDEGASGRLNQNRLGGLAVLPVNVNLSRY